MDIKDLVVNADNFNREEIKKYNPDMEYLMRFL